MLEMRRRTRCHPTRLGAPGRRGCRSIDDRWPNANGDARLAGWSAGRHAARPSARGPRAIIGAPILAPAGARMAVWAAQVWQWSDDEHAVFCSRQTKASLPFPPYSSLARTLPRLFRTGRSLSQEIPSDAPSISPSSGVELSIHSFVMAYTRSRSNSGIGDWYTSSYSNTISRLRTTPFMPGANFEQTTAQLHELEATRSHMSAGSVAYQGGGGVRDRVQVMDAATGLPMTSRQIAQATDATNQTGANGAGGVGGAAQKKKGQTLFGPDVGFEEADAVGGWTKGDAQTTAATTTPTVPLGVVKTWIERAKATDVDSTNARVHKTTTLQALVNLKRPSLALIALTASNPDAHPSATGAAATSHALRFNYDASSPAVLVTLSIHPRSYYPYLAQRPITTLYAARHEGGFGKTWQLPDDHAMDLARLMDEEMRVKDEAKRAREEEEERRRRSAAMDGEDEDEEDDLKKGIHRRHSTAGRAATNAARHTTPEAPQPTAARSRFGMAGIFGRRQRRQDEEQGIVAGIRNAQGGSAPPTGGDVMEMQPTSLAAAAGTTNPSAVASDGEDKEKEKDVMEEDGIRVLIRLDALDEQGMHSRFLLLCRAHRALQATRYRPRMPN